MLNCNMCVDCDIEAEDVRAEQSLTFRILSRTEHSTAYSSFLPDIFLLESLIKNDRSDALSSISTEACRPQNLVVNLTG